MRLVPEEFSLPGGAQASATEAPEQTAEAEATVKFLRRQKWAELMRIFPRNTDDQIAKSLLTQNLTGNADRLAKDVALEGMTQTFRNSAYRLLHRAAHEFDPQEHRQGFREFALQRVREGLRVTLEYWAGMSADHRKFEPHLVEESTKFLQNNRYRALHGDALERQKTMREWAATTHQLAVNDWDILVVECAKRYVPWLAALVRNRDSAIAESAVSSTSHVLVEKMYKFDPRKLRTFEEFAEPFIEIRLTALELKHRKKR